MLVTVVALGDWSRRLEPGAPPGEERIAAAGEAARKGLRVALFLRPIIPGVTDAQAREILELARDHGIRDVVPGTLRVTPGILGRLEAAGVRIPPGRIPRRPRSGRDQVPIRASDLKARVVEEARRLGLRVHPSACSHNMHSHGEPCHACRLGPCYAEPEPPDPGEVEEALEVLGVRHRGVEIRPPLVIVRRPSGKSRALVEEVLMALTRLQVRIV